MLFRSIDQDPLPACGSAAQGEISQDRGHDNEPGEGEKDICVELPDVQPDDGQDDGDQEQGEEKRPELPRTVVALGTRLCSPASLRGDRRRSGPPVQFRPLLLDGQRAYDRLELRAEHSSVLGDELEVDETWAIKQIDAQFGQLRRCSRADA